MRAAGMTDSGGADISTSQTVGGGSGPNFNHPLPSEDRQLSDVTLTAWSATEVTADTVLVRSATLLGLQV